VAQILKFVGTIASQGDMRVIIIPKRMHPKIKKHEGEQVKIIVEEL